MAVKRCPMCRRVNPDSSRQCDCGYEFGQEIPAVLELLAAQRSTGWAQLISGVVLILTFLALLVAAAAGGVFVVLLFGALAGGIGLVKRGSSNILRSRTSTRELEAMTKLPEARLLDR